jgi:hypothetical protein
MEEMQTTVRGGGRKSRCEKRVAARGPRPGVIKR